MKNIIILFFCCISSLIYGQVTSVDYLMKYNCETNQYDVSIIILEGSASSIPERAQFNSQISIVVPAGELLALTDNYMPLQGNQNYNGSVPLDWNLSNPIFAPEAQPESDFYSVFPKLVPASFYNDLEQGDVVKLFSFTVGESGQYDENVRFYINGVDPDDMAPGMSGGDFSNGFTIGSPVNIYNGNVEEACTISNIEEALAEEIKIYPNPFQNNVSIELLSDQSKVTLLGNEGKIYFQSNGISKGILSLNTSHFPKGVYYLSIETINGITNQKVVKF